MKVMLDGSALDVADQTLGCALTSALEAAGDRLIIEAIADGVRVPEEDLATPPERSPYASEIKFLSADPLALMKVTLGEAADSLEHIVRWQSEAGEQIQAGDLESAMPIIGRLLKGWGAVRTTVELIVEGGLLSHSQATTSLQPLVDDLATLLRLLKESIEGQDWSSVSDVLIYDLEEQADSWRQWLGDAAGSLEKVS